MTQEATSPPATAPAAAPAADPNPGQATFETNSAVGLPGDTAQVYHHFATAAVLHGMVIDEGGELQKVIAGPHNIGPQPDGTFKFGQTIPAGAYCIAIVKNVTQETKSLKGAFLAAPVAGAGPQTGSLTSPHTPSQAQHSGGGVPRAPSGASPTVTPGSNEVAILLSYMDAKRVLDVVTGAQMAIHINESEKAGIVRAFHHAFQRSGMGG